MPGDGEGLGEGTHKLSLSMLARTILSTRRVCMCVARSVCARLRVRTPVPPRMWARVYVYILPHHKTVSCFHSLPSLLLASQCMLASHIGCPVAETISYGGAFFRS